jgi:hypothetical protein
VHSLSNDHQRAAEKKSAERAETRRRGDEIIHFYTRVESIKGRIFLAY